MNTLDKSINVDILINGRSAKITNHEGKLYVEGRIGTEYSILINNNSNKRILVIPSVDQINVLSGKSATPNDTGYVISKYSDIKIKGFRVSNEKVAAFTFNKKDKSYSKYVTGNTNNVGIIRVIAYAEKQEPKPEVIVVKEKEYIYPGWPYQPYDPVPYNPIHPWRPYIGDPYYGTTTCQGIGSNSINSSSLQNCASNNISADFCSQPKSSLDEPFSLGTEFGQSKISKVTNVEFERGKYLGQIDIYYSTRQSLLNMGVQLDRIDKISHPKAFKDQGFCSIPSGWEDNN